MNTNTETLVNCELEIRHALVFSLRARLAGVTEEKADRMAAACVQWATHYYRRGIVGRRDLRARVKERYQQEYGSIWMMILFSLIWKLIEKWLFD